MPKASNSCLHLLWEDEGMLDNLAVARAGIDLSNHDNPAFQLLDEEEDKNKEMKDKIEDEKTDRDSESPIPEDFL